MRRIDGIIPDTISGELKQKYKASSVLPPGELVFAISEDSWTRDGRENLPISAQLVKSLIRCHTTDNSVVVKGERMRASESKGKGDPVIWGPLDVVLLSLMGTDEQPLFIVGGSGRQKVKGAEYTTDLLRWAKEVLTEEYKTHKDTDKAVKHAILKVQQQADAFDAAWVDKLDDRDFAERCKGMSVAAELQDEHWQIIFSDKIPRSGQMKKPLVTKDYSAVYYLKVSFDDAAKPTAREALERAKLANQRVPSRLSDEADSVRRLIESYVVKDGYLETTAISRACDFVTNPIAVGPAVGVTYEYVEQLYRFSQCSPTLQARVDAEKDPIKALKLMARIARKCFDGASDEHALTRNTMSEANQLVALEPVRRVSRTVSAPTPVTVSAPSADRFITMARSPMSGLTDIQREGARAVAAWIKFQAGDAAALEEVPYLRATVEADSDPLSEAIDAVDAWNGQGLPLLREPATVKGSDGEREVVESDAQMLAVAQKLIDAVIVAIPPKTKAADKPVWCAEALRAKRSN